MQSEDDRDQNDSSAPQDETSRLRPVVKVNDRGDERLSGDYINLSPRAQRRMAIGRRSGY